ncbi:MAG: hypothetical protein CVU84_10430 [Firmicutes bacterium HGW-Firmicutes-1]|jgi:anti-anti-sigma factor|nr:MAG: hypothetical protein CVU84_10430 [Firmicutes bacterium HGW-Firmicutes-1]
MKKTIEGKRVIFTISEGLTANKIPQYNQNLEELLPEPGAYDECILNLALTNNIDSAGVTFVIGMYKKMKAIEKNFCVAGANEDVQCLFKLMKLDKFFDMQS